MESDYDHGETTPQLASPHYLPPHCGSEERGEWRCPRWKSAGDNVLIAFHGDGVKYEIRGRLQDLRLQMAFVSSVMVMPDAERSQHSSELHVLRDCVYATNMHQSALPALPAFAAFVWPTLRRSLASGPSK